MEFTLGSLAQKPEQSYIYKNGYQLKTVAETVIQPNTSSIIKTNLFAKHADDNHIKLFLNDMFADKLKLENDEIKTGNRLFEFVVKNVTDSEIIVRKNMHIVDIVAVHDVINNLSKLIPDANIPTQLQLDDNKAQSTHIENMLKKEKDDKQIADDFALQSAAKEAETIRKSLSDKQTKAIEEELVAVVEDIKLPIEEVKAISEPIEIVKKAKRGKKAAV